MMTHMLNQFLLERVITFSRFECYEAADALPFDFMRKPDDCGFCDVNNNERSVNDYNFIDDW